jgi:hypothetical protein
MPEGWQLDVEGIPQRTVVVVFTAQHLSYFPGERACFLPEEAQALADQGVATPPAPATLTSGPFTAPAMTSLITALQAVTDGGFLVAIDGPQRSMRGSFLTVTTAQSICTICNANGLGAFGTMTVNASAPYRFVIASATVGPASSIGYALPGPAATDLSAGLQLTLATGAAITPGVSTE